MTALFNLEIEFEFGVVNDVKNVSVDGIEGTKITGLEMDFEIVKTVKPEPNKAEIVIFNMPDDQIAELESGTLDSKDSRKTFCIIRAGYKEATSVLFAGFANEVRSERQGIDVVTTITAGDGSKNVLETNLSKSFAEGATVQDVLEFVKKEIGVAGGELKGNLAAVFQNGFSASGSSKKILDAIASKAGAEWSIQDQELVLIPIGEASSLPAVKLNENTGLLGSPTKTEKGIEAISLLLPQINTFGLLDIESEDSTAGVYKAIKCTHSGSNRGSGGQTKTLCKRIG